MLKKLFALVVVALSLVSSSVVLAAEPAAHTMTAEEFMASLKFKSGKIELPNGIATLDLPAGFRYLDPADSSRVLEEAWGNPPGGQTLGMIFPTKVSPVSQDGWGIVITYDEDGHVSDSDADQIDYDQLLKDMQGGMEQANEERTKQGFPAVALVGWAEPPHYDKSNHKLYWAKEIKFADAPENTLNYNIRVLGREGVLVLNAVAGMSQLAMVKAEMPQVLAATGFKAGNSYSDFNSETDKVAEYGLAALIAGGIGAKMGLFAKLFALLVAFKKAVLIGLVALGAGLRKLFGMKRKANTPTVGE